MGQARSVTTYVSALAVFAASMAHGAEGVDISAIGQVPHATAEMVRSRTPIRVRGAVSYCDPAWGLLFLQDATGDTFIYTTNDPIQLPVGRLVTVTARAFFAPTGPVWAGESYEMEGGFKTLLSRPVTIAEVEDGSWDSELVEATGVLRRQYEHAGYRVSFRLFAGRQWTSVVLPRRDDRYAEQMVNARVKVRGVSAARFQGTKRVGGQLFVSSFRDIEVLDHPAAAAVPAMTGKALRQADLDQPALHAQRIEGRVVAEHKQLLIVQDAEDVPIPVITLDTSSDAPRAGQLVTATGFPASTPFGVGLVDARVQVPGPAILPARPGGKFTWEPLAGVIEDIESLPEGQRFLVRGEKERIAVLIPAHARDPLGFPKGSSVRFWGMATPSGADGAPRFAAVDAELVQQQGISWRKAATAAAAMLFLVGGAVAWVFTLRRTVRRQVAVIEEARSTLERRVQERTRELSAEIEARRVAEVELLEARDSAEQASRAKSSFLASMSHEFRTPLNAILGYSEMLEEDAREAASPAADDLVRIQVAARHLMSLVNDVLDLARIESGKLSLNLERASARELSDEVVATVKPLAAKGNNTLSVELASGGDAVVEVDRLRFHQSLLNLLSNACKFTRDGQVTLAVRREEMDGREWVCWDVRDTGPGIAAEDRSKLFQAFSRLESGPGKCVREGTGLGLSITKNLCEMMGGAVTVESELGKGSRFTIHMPAQSTRDSQRAQ